MSRFVHLSDGRWVNLDYVEIIGTNIFQEPSVWMRCGQCLLITPEDFMKLNQEIVECPSSE